MPVRWDLENPSRPDPSGVLLYRLHFQGPQFSNGLRVFSFRKFSGCVNCEQNTPRWRREMREEATKTSNGRGHPKGACGAVEGPGNRLSPWDAKLGVKRF